MSEKIYAWLLRLYPSHFRDAYGDAALQLFRDRSRHERGFFPSLHLWLDLLADLAISVPRQYRSVQPALISASVQPRSDGMPSFQVLEGESPRLGALLLGVVLSLGIAAASASIGRLEHYLSPAASPRNPEHFADTRGAAPGRSVPQATGYARQEAIGPADPKRNDSQSKPISTLVTSVVPQQRSQPPTPQDPTRAMVPGVAEDVKVDAAERQRVVHAAIANLKQHYIDPNVGQKMAEALLAHDGGGEYDAVTDGGAFADLLTRHMRDVSHDRHLVIVYSKAAMPDRPPGPTPEGLARYRKAMEQNNCTFEKVEVLQHNIGYLKLNSFPDASVCQPTARAAMASLNHVDAIIFDLRDNTGGFPNMVALIAAYLFDHPEYLYNPRENTTQQSWTISPIPGNRLADKPVYLLTSANTLSGAEQFCYNLKMLKRATLVGETTGGSAHAGSFHRIGDHFGIGIPETRAINPLSKNDWDGTGVEPDVKVKAADALDRAEKLAERKLRK